MLRRLYLRLLSPHQQVACLLRRRQPTHVTQFCNHAGNGSTDGNEKQSQQQGSQGGKRKGISAVLNQEGEEFLRNMDEITTLRKKRIEAEIQDLAQREQVPQNLTPAHWKILLTECNSINKRGKYLKYLLQIEHRRENLKRKKQEAEKPEYMGHRVLDEFTYPSRLRFKMENRFACRKSLVFGSPIVVDMDYPRNVREERNASSQISLCYGNNLRHEFPFHLHITGYENRHFGKLIEVEDYEKNMFATFHKGCFTDLFDRDQLMYLSPDGPPLTRHDPETVYVIGGLVDITARSNVSKAKAKELGIRCGRIPLDRHVRMLQGHVLTLDAVFNIMLNLSVMHDWGRAIMAGLPKTAFVKLGEEDHREVLRRKAPHLMQTRAERNWRKQGRGDRHWKE